MANLCRLCLAEGETLTDVAEIRHGLPISVLVMIICPVKVEPDDNLPREICDECLHTVLSAYKLRDVSSNTDRYLRSCDEEILQKLEVEESLQVENIENDEASRILSESEHDDDHASVAILNNELLVEEHDEGKENLILYEFGEEEVAEAPRSTKYTVNCSNVETKKSAVWNYFGNLNDLEGNPIEEEKDYYFCTICVEEMNTTKPKYKIESTATSVLFNHLTRVHGINKEEMIENFSVGSNHTVAELVACEICSKSVNAKSLAIHTAIEHRSGELSRTNDKTPLYKVNCFKNSSKSLAWDYFGALENLEGKQIDAYYFYCRLCVEEEGKLNPKYTKNTSTSILLHHLKNVHTPKDPVEVAKRKMPEPIFTDSKRSKAEEFSCQICGEQLESRRSLNRHLLNEHNEEQPRNFLCDFENCGKTFTQRDTLLKHIKNIHEGSKFPCDRCPAELATRMSLRRHIESCHLKLRSFTCETCNATYTEQKTLKNHIQKVHMGIDNKKVPCELCDLKFPNQWSLRRHLVTHTGEKPYSCSHCYKSYTCKGDLTTHMIKVHADDIYKCEYPGCEEGFRLRSSLREHYKVHYMPDDDEDESSQYFEVISEEFIE